MESSPLPCQVCSRPLSPHLPFFCITCARNIVYEPRLEHAQALLQKEALNNEISRAIHAGNSPSVGADKRGSQAREDDGTVDCIAVERARSQRAESVNRTQMLHAENNSLRSETKKLKDAIADRRRDLDKRKTAHNVAVKALDLQEAQAVAPLQNEIAARELKGNKVHEQTAGSRMLLCREAASLCGLQQRKRRKGTSSRDVYFLGGVPVVDLRDLNSGSSLLSSTYPAANMECRRRPFARQRFALESRPPPAPSLALPLAPTSRRAPSPNSLLYPSHHPHAAFLLQIPHPPSRPPRGRRSFCLAHPPAPATRPRPPPGTTAARARDRGSTGLQPLRRRRDAACVGRGMVGAHAGRGRGRLYLGGGV